MSKGRFQATQRVRRPQHVNALCATAHKAFYALFPVMRCCRRIPLRYQGGAEIQQRITVGDQNDCRKAIRSSSSRYDGSGAGSSESKSMIAFAFLWRSISAQSVVLSSRMSPSQARMVLRSHSRGQQVCCRRVAQQVRADLLGGQRRCLLDGPRRAMAD